MLHNCYDGWDGMTRMSAYTIVCCCSFCNVSFTFWFPVRAHCTFVLSFVLVFSRFGQYSNNSCPPPEMSGIPCGVVLSKLRDQFSQISRPEGKKERKPLYTAQSCFVTSTTLSLIIPMSGTKYLVVVLQEMPSACAYELYKMASSRSAKVYRWCCKFWWVSWGQSHGNGLLFLFIFDSSKPRLYIVTQTYYMT